MIELDKLAKEYSKRGKIISVGLVVSVVDNKIVVQTENETGCAGCSSKGECGTASLSSLFAPAVARALLVENTLNSKIGDKVLLSLIESEILKHSMMAYGLPLALLIFGAWLGLNFLNSDILSTVLGFIFLVIGWLFTKFVYTPVVPKLEKVF